MTYISTVVVDPPTHGPFLVRWQQPYLQGDDGLDWYVTTDGVTRKVQRDRFTDEIYTCHVLVVGGTTSFDLEDGAHTTPADAWTTPTLTGLKLRWNGQDGSVADADLTDTTAQTIRRTGTWCRQVQRWTHSKITSVGGGSDPIGTEVLGHHSILSYRADRTDVVELDVLISNASASVATQGQGITGFFGHMGFDDVALLLPAGWSAVADRPLAGGGDHVFPSKMGTVRRWVLYQTASSGAATAAAEIMALRCQGRAYAPGGVGRSFQTVRAYDAGKSLLPDLELGFNYNGIGGWAGAKQRGVDIFGALNNVVQSGGTNSNAPMNVYIGAMGLFHPPGGTDPGEPGGRDIVVHRGFDQVREYMQYARLRAAMIMDGCGIFLFNRATGEPLRTSDFGDAYTTPGALVGSWNSGAQYVGSQPFYFSTNNNAGYEYKTTATREFTGWFPPVWPPHFHDTRGTLPDGSYNGATVDAYVPVHPSHWGAPPHSLNVFTCSYTTQLISTPIPHPVYGTNDPPFYSTVTQGYRDPEDSAHSSRMIADLRPSLFLLGDLLSTILIDMLGEWFGIEYSEVGHVPNLYSYNGQDPPNNTPNIWSLKKRLEFQVGAPGIAKYGVFRWDAWPGAVFAMQYAVSSPAKRNAGYPAKGIKKRVEMMFDYIRLAIIPLNGASYHVGPGIGGGLSEMFIAGVYGGAPISQHLRGMQIGLEMPLVHFAMWCLGVQIGRTNHYPLVIAAARGHVAKYWLYTNYTYGPNEWGPKKYCSIWNTITNQPENPDTAERYGDGSGNPGHPNHEVMLEMAYRIDGDRSWLLLSNRFGFLTDPATEPAVRAAQLMSYGNEWAFNVGLIALMLTEPGPDVVVQAPTDTLLTAHVDLNIVITAGLSLTAPTVPPDDPPPLDINPAPGPGPIDPPVDPPVEPPAQPPTSGVPGLGTPGAGLGTIMFDSSGNPAGGDVMLTWSQAGGEFRLVDGDLQREHGLAAAVVISLFSDARDDVDRAKSVTLQDLRGWWGEAVGDRFGSHLWRLERAKATLENQRLADSFTRRALQWLIEQGIARQIDVRANYVTREMLVLQVRILRGDARRWAFLWQGATNVSVRLGNVVLQLGSS